MFYRLNDEFVLRGWQKMTGVLVRRPENRYKVLKDVEFRVLMLCDGETDFGDSVPSGEDQWSFDDKTAQTGVSPDQSSDKPAHDSASPVQFGITSAETCNMPELSKEELSARDDFLARGIIRAVAEPEPLLTDQVYRFYPNRFVESCYWSITGRCNYRCRHCFVDGPEGSFGELSHEQALDVIRQMAVCGVLRVDLSGGEPFVREDFWELVDALRAEQIVVETVYTNAWKLDEKVLEAFAEREMRPHFSISFDGLGWHDWMRGVKGAEKAALDALALCRDRGFSTDVEMCIHQGNVAALGDTLLALADLGVDSVKCSQVSETPLWMARHEGMAMPFKEYVEAMIDYIPRFYRDGRPVDLTICNVITMNKDDNTYQIVTEKHKGTDECMDCYLCGAARFSCCISPEGRLLPCLPVAACKEQEHFPLIQDIGLAAGLSDSFYMHFVDKRVKDLLAENKTCHDCPHNLVCAGGCRALALELTGDLMGPDTYQCFLWENGYVERIREAAEAAIAEMADREDGDCR